MKKSRTAPGRPEERFLDLRAPDARWDRDRIAYALVYPNRHAVGMANLGVQTLAHLLSRLPGALCHRAFSDYPETLEAGRPLRDYDAVALSLSFEGDYGEALRLLSAAGIALRAVERSAADPLVLAGGVAVSLNPEPLAPFLDAVFVGEAEAGQGLAGLHELLRRHRRVPRPSLLRLLAEARLPGLYVPSAYEVEERDGRVVGRRTLGPASDVVERQWAAEPWEPARTHVWTPEDSFGGAYLLEVSRGCPHACRFCAAGHVTRPARFLPLDVLAPLAAEGARQVGRLGLVGAAVSDHPGLRELAGGILAAGAGFTVSSFRVENLDAPVLDLLARGGMKTLTVALEAGSDALRSRLGKGIGEDDLLRAARLAADAGIENLRVYAMVGLPGEEDDDVEALADAAVRAREALGGGLVTVSVAPFVPKPHTPFQWETMAPEPVLRSRIRLLERRLGPRRGVKAVAEAPKWARVQGFLSRSGRGGAPLLERAASSGDWRELLRSPEAASALDRPRAPDDVLPWDFIGGMPSKEHLLRETERARRGAPPVLCRPGTCAACEICPSKG